MTGHKNGTNYCISFRFAHNHKPHSPPHVSPCVEAYHVQAFRSHFYLLCKPERGYCADTYGDHTERDGFREVHATCSVSHTVCSLHACISQAPSCVFLLQVTLFNQLVLTMIGNVGSPCEQDATLTDFTSGCNSTVEASQVLRPHGSSANTLPTFLNLLIRQALRAYRGVVVVQAVVLTGNRVFQCLFDSHSSVSAVPAAGAFSDLTLAADCIRPLTVHLRETLDCKTSESIHTFPQL